MSHLGLLTLGPVELVPVVLPGRLSDGIEKLRMVPVGALEDGEGGVAAADWVEADHALDAAHAL